MAGDGDSSGPDDAELLRNGLRNLREEGDADGLLRTARSILYWAERLQLADPGRFDEELAVFTEPDIKALRCAIRQGAHILRAPAGDWQAKAMALLAEVDKHPILSEVAARGRASLAAAGMGSAELRGLERRWSLGDGQPAVNTDLHGHRSPVTVCLLLAGGQQLVTADQAEVLIWDTGRRALVAIHPNDDPAEIMGACAPRSGDWLCTIQVRGGQLGHNVGNPASLKLWDLRAGGVPRTLAAGKDGPHHCELSPDERWLVAQHADHAVHFWDTATWERSGVIQGNSLLGAIHRGGSARHTPDDSWFVLADADGRIGLWDPETLTLERMLDGHGSGVTEVAAPDDGSWLASTNGRELCIWDTGKGTLLVRADASDAGCSGLAADPGGRWAAACFGADTLRVIPAVRRPRPGPTRWTPLVRRARRAVRGSDPKIFVGAACGTLDDGSRILSVSAVQENDGRSVWSWSVVSCWDTTTGHRITGPASRPVNRLVGRPWVALPRHWRWGALAGDYDIEIFDPRTTEIPAEFSYSPDRVRSTAGSARSVAAGFESGVVRLYSPGLRDPSGAVTGRAPADLAGCFAAPNGRSVIAWSGWRSRQAFVLDPSSGAVRCVLEGENTGVFLNKIINFCCCAPDGSWVATADDTGTVRVWDPETGRQVSQATGLDGEDFLPGPCASAGWMATSTTDGHLWIRDRRGVRQHEIRVASRPLRGCAGGDWWLAVEHEASLSIWNPLTGAHVRDLPGQFGVCPLPPARGEAVPLLACTGPNGHVTIIQPLTGQSHGDFGAAGRLDARREGTRVRAVHPAMRWLVTSDDFGSLHVWDVGEGKLTRLSRGYDTPVVACGVTGDGSMLITADQSGTLRVWDAATWRQIAQERPGGPLADCCLSPGGTHIYAVGNRGAYCYETPQLTSARG